jgi:hypothetical protein
VLHRNTKETLTLFSVYVRIYAGAIFSKNLVKFIVTLNVHFELSSTRKIIVFFVLTKDQKRNAEFSSSIGTLSRDGWAYEDMHG